jgi:hypothetical protein
MNNAADRRLRWVLTACLAATLAVDAGAAAGKGKGKGKSKVPASAAATQKAFDDALDSQRPAVVECVMQFGINQGAPKVQLDIKVLVSGSGQLFSSEINVTQTGGDQAGMGACIKKALTLAPFPQSRNTMTEMRRTWTFASAP